MHLSPGQYVMLAASLACVSVQAATLRILVKRKLRSELPVFFRYTAYCVLIGVVGLISYAFACECWQYYYLFWVCNALMMCFEFGVMYEVFVNALKPYSALIDLGKMLFRWAGVFLLLAALLTAFATNGTESSRILSGVSLMERSLRLMQIGLLLLFFVFERRLGLSWRSYTMAIALGLGLSAGANLSTSYLSAHFPALESGFGIFANVLYLARSGRGDDHRRQPQEHGSAARAATDRAPGAAT